MATKLSLGAIQKVFQFSKYRGHDKILKDVSVLGWDQKLNILDAIGLYKLCISTPRPAAAATQLVFVGFKNKRIQVEFPVTKDALNLNGSLHGGFTATVVDVINIFSLVANGIDGAPGVTVDLHIRWQKHINVFSKSFFLCFLYI